MKKIYTILFLLVFLLGGINAQKVANVKLNSNHTIGQNVTTPTKDVQATLNQNFDVISFPPVGWTVDGTGWYNSGGTYVQSNNYESAGTPNGHFAYYDAFNEDAAAVGSLITPVMHPTAGSATFTYKVNYYLLNATYIAGGAAMYIEFSTNGTTWTTSTTNVLATLPNYNTASSGWQNKTVDLTAYNGGSVQVRFRCVSDWGGLSVGIDDVTGPETDIATFVNELALNSSFQDVAGMSYYGVIPISQFAAVTVSGSVSNLGSANQTNVVFHANDAANGLTLTSPAITSTAGATDTISVDITAPTVYTDFAFATNVTQTQTDENPANNTGDSVFFTADPTMYFRTINLNALLTPYSFGTGAPAITGMEYGANYHFLANGTIDSVSVIIYGAHGTGTVVGKIYDINTSTGARTLLGQTAPYTPLGTPEWKNIALTAPIAVTAGQLVTATVQMNCTIASNDTIMIGSEQGFPGDPAVAGAAWLKVGGTWGWYSITGTVPIVGMILDDATGNDIVSQVGNVAVYPNPANDVVFVSEVANITVINMIGQVVATVNNANQINVSSLPTGTYIVRVQNDNGNTVQKISIVR